ncbi:MAG: porin family protein [Gemmatimonadota bacterium]|nr:porin family protein [Gemmatimonadota bacterium]
MKTLRVALIAGALAALSAPTLVAQVELEVTPFAGGTVFLADPPNQFQLGRTQGSPLTVQGGSFDDAWTLGVNAGVRFAETWAVEGMFSWIPTSLNARSGLLGKEDINGYMYGVTLLYYVPVDWPVTPFLGLGVGGETFDYDTPGLKTENEYMGNVVGGLFLPVTDVFGVRFEARDCFARFDSGIATVDDAWENDLMLSVGFSFRTAIR